MMTLEHAFGDGGARLSCKIDVSPPVWLSPVFRGWVDMEVHAAYGEPSLPNLQTMRLEENIAEKISRLNRTTTARDMYDLAWVAANERSLGGLDRALLRRLAVLKIWVDAHGVAARHARWKPAHEAAAFDPDHWLRERRADEFDLEDIGALACRLLQRKTSPCRSSITTRSSLISTTQSGSLLPRAVRIGLSRWASSVISPVDAFVILGCTEDPD
jgi:nucleotidyltransferase AbiEii toxin of type IV toxin-antitoxin system